MASFNLTVEDSSPLISYAPAGAWSDSPSTDALIPSYSGSSLHTTSAQGATATINFNGTGISIYGGHRPNYGAFTISVDGQTIASGDASSPTATAQQLLGSASGLTNGPHTAVLTNSGGSAIDIDFVDVQSQVGPPNSQMSATTYDDTDPRITYSPAGTAWSTNTGSDFMNNSLHYTSTAGAQASLSFTGDAVAIYGTVSPDHANIQVSVDGEIKSFTGGAGGLASTLHTQVLLYYANDLGPAQHTLSVTSDPEQGTGPFLDIDAITVYSATGSNGAVGGNGNNNQGGGGAPPSSGPSPVASAGTSVGANGASKSPPLGPIIGGVMGGVFLILVVLALLFFILRRRRTRRRNNVMDEPKTPALPIQRPAMMESGFSDILSPVTPQATFLAPSGSQYKSRQSRLSIAPSYYTDEPAYPARAHSRASSSASTAPMVPREVPKMKMPKLPTRYSPDMMGVNDQPTRPSQRPPPLDLNG